MAVIAVWALTWYLAARRRRAELSEAQGLADRLLKIGADALEKDKN
jgi:hypothetical protein